MNKEMEQLLFCHGIDIQKLDELHAYHLTLSMDLFYLADANGIAEQIEDGMDFNEIEVSVIIKNLMYLHDSLNYYREKLQLNGCYEITEFITMPNCRLENGKVTGDMQEANQISKSWIACYKKQEASNYTLTVAMYIQLLLKEEINISDLIKAGN